MARPNLGRGRHGTVPELLKDRRGRSQKVIVGSFMNGRRPKVGRGFHWWMLVIVEKLLWLLLLG
jgi:hypothetical protein